MTPPPEPPTFDEIMSECLARLESEGPGVIDETCTHHPEHADTLRRRIGMLLNAGLVDLGSDREFPERLGEFRLLRKLGAGGMGVVYLAEQDSPKREVALKLVRPEMLYFGRARERFEREIESTGRLQHPGIVTIHAIGEDDGIPYFAMEHVNGLSLAAVLATVRGRSVNELRGADLAACLGLADGVLPSVFHGSWVECCFRLIRQAAEAVQHAHDHGVLHRDLKPSNMMVTPEGRLVLLDFGLATIEGGTQLTRTGAKLGSLEYMSPEQLRGDLQAIDRRSDIYSLAVTLYEMLTLRSPYGAPTEEVVRARILAGRLPALRDANAAVARDGETICAKAMDPDPEQRYGSASEFAQDVGNFLGLRPIEGRRPSVLMRTRRWARRSPAAAVATALAVLLLVGGPSVIAWLQYDKAIQVGREKAATDTSLRLAFQAIEKLGTDLAQHELQHLPGTAQLQRRILENTLGIYRSFLSERTEDVRVWRMTADAEGRLAAVLLFLDQHDTARAAAQRAEELYIRLSKRDPENLELVLCTLNEQQRLAAIEVTLGRYEIAEMEFVRVRAALTKLLNDRPRSIKGLDLLAKIANNLSAVYRPTRRPKLAIAAAEESLRIRKDIVTTHPTRDSRDRLVNAHTSVMTQYLHRDPPRVDANGGPAIKLCEELLREAPDHAGYRHRLAKIYNALGLSAHDQGRHEDGLGYFEQALRIRTQLLKDYPHVPMYWSDVGSVNSNIARLLNSLSDPQQRAAAIAKDGIRHHQRARTLTGNAYPYRRRLKATYIQLARAYVKSGQHAKVHETVLAFLAEDLRVGGELWTAAVYLAWGMPHCAADPKLNDSERQRRLELYGSTAVDYLREALTENPDIVNLTIPRLASLRERKDFQALQQPKRHRPK